MKDDILYSNGFETHRYDKTISIISIQRYQFTPLLELSPYVFGRLKKARESAIPSLGRVKGGVSAPCFYA